MHGVLSLVKQPRPAVVAVALVPLNGVWCTLQLTHCMASLSLNHSCKSPAPSVVIDPVRGGVVFAVTLEVVAVATSPPALNRDV